MFGLFLWAGLSGLAAPLESAVNVADVEARALEQALMAPCCYSQQVSVHQSEAAAQVKADVRERLARGETRAQILDAYVALYGKRILAEPPAEGFDLSLYTVPIATFALTLAAVAWFLRRVSGRESSVTAGALAAAPDVTLDQRLDDELRDLD